MAAVRRPRGKVATADIVSQLNPTLGRDFHHIDILPARSSGTIFAIPGEGKELSVWRPRWRCRISSIRHAADRRSVRIHDVELRQTGTSADPCDLRSGLWVEDGRDIRATEACNPMAAATVRVSNPDLRITSAGRGIRDVTSVR